MNFRLSGNILLWLIVPILVRAQPSDNHALFTSVLRQHVEKGEVDYARIKTDMRLSEYLKHISQTNPFSIKNDNDRLAFWINAYNAFTLKLIIDHLPVSSIREITKGETGPWDIVWIEIGGKEYSLNQIEHEIIRKEFDEPRIHMALVCAAKSCPPLRSEAYTGKGLNRQLEENGLAFLKDATKNRYDKETGTLHLSELFNWYGSDFDKKYGSAVQFALKTLGLEAVKPKAIRYLPYDWSLNSAPARK